MDRRNGNRAVIVAFQKVIHKRMALFHHSRAGCVLWAMFKGSLQEGRNAEIIAGFPECVQGDKPRAKLLIAAFGLQPKCFAGMLGKGNLGCVHPCGVHGPSKKLNLLKERT